MTNDRPADDPYAPTAETLAKVQDQKASDAAAARLGADQELKAVVAAHVQAERLAAQPRAAKASDRSEHLDDVRPAPVAGHLTVPRAYLNPGALKSGKATVKVEAMEQLPMVRRRWPVVALVVAAVAGAFLLAVALGGGPAGPGHAGAADTGGRAQTAAPVPLGTTPGTSVATAGAEPALGPATATSDIEPPRPATGAAQASAPPSAPATATATEAGAGPGPAPTVKSTAAASSASNSTTFDFKKNP